MLSRAIVPDHRMAVVIDLRDRGFHGDHFSGLSDAYRQVHRRGAARNHLRLAHRGAESLDLARTSYSPAAARAR